MKKKETKMHFVMFFQNKCVPGASTDPQHMTKEIYLSVNVCTQTLFIFGFTFYIMCRLIRIATIVGFKIAPS